MIHRQVLKLDGATFISRRAPGESAVEFFGPSDSWFRPITVRPGPDGANRFSTVPWRLGSIVKPNAAQALQARASPFAPKSVRVPSIHVHTTSGAADLDLRPCRHAPTKRSMPSPLALLTWTAGNGCFVQRPVTTLPATRSARIRPVAVAGSAF